MTNYSFDRAVGLFGRTAKITAFLQGGLSVTGEWRYLAPSSSAIVITDGHGVRNVVPIETITSLREVSSAPASSRSLARGREPELGTVG